MRKYWPLLLALLLGAAIAPRAIYAQSGPSLGALSAQVGAGQIIRFQGDGFVGGERVALWATTATQAVLSGQYVYASKYGRIEFGFRVPADGISGQWAMTAYGLDSATPAVAGFGVVGTDAAKAELQAWVSPASGGVGTVFSFAARGFAANEKLSYWFTAPDGAVRDATPGGAKANGDGRVDLSWRSPANGPAGKWVITIQGIKSGIARGIPFEMVVAP